MFARPSKSKREVMWNRLPQLDRTGQEIRRPNREAGPYGFRGRRASVASIAGFRVCHTPGQVLLLKGHGLEAGCIAQSPEATHFESYAYCSSFLRSFDSQHCSFASQESEVRPPRKSHDKREFGTHLRQQVGIEVHSRAIQVTHHRDVLLHSVGVKDHPGRHAHESTLTITQIANHRESCCSHKATSEGREGKGETRKTRWHVACQGRCC
jgi:hypothetical protein